MTQELKYYSSRINSVSTGPIELEVEPGRSAPFLEMAGGMRLLLLWRFIVAVALVQVWSAGFGEGYIGINYGRVANNLPTPKEVAKLVKSLGVKHIKIFDYDREVLKAFENTNIDVTICVPNDQIIGLAQSEKAARTWIHNHVEKRVRKNTKIKFIAVGNEILSGDPVIWSSLVPAMWQLYSGLRYYDLDDKIKISTPHSMGVLAVSYPPSAGVFQDSIRESIMLPMLNFLELTSSSFMMNIYPYFSYLDDGGVNISPGYALFLPNATEVDDPNTGLHYSNIFDAMFDAAVSAMKNLNFTNIPLIVTETGWPSKGDPNEFPAGLANAKTYNNNLVKHVRSESGTPMRPGKEIDTFIFALFNENLKPGALSERNFGLFYPNMSKVYEIDLD